MLNIPYRRINLFAGPGTGKSTAAHWLMWKLKSNFVNADMAREVCKRAAFDKTKPMPKQAIILGDQLREEDAALATGCVVVSDSPILLQAAYASTPGLQSAIVSIAKERDQEWPTLNLFLYRGDRKFNPEGRSQTLEQARLLDSTIHDILDGSKTPYSIVSHGDYEGLWYHVSGILEGNP